MAQTQKTVNRENKTLGDKGTGFANRLALAMRGKKVNQTSFAAALDVSPSTVSRWLAGAVPRKLVLAGIAEHLDVDVNWLKDGVGDQGYFSTLIRSQFRLDGSKMEFGDWDKMTEEEKERFINANVDYGRRSAGLRVAILRKRIRLSLAQFAAKCGCTPSYISRLENGSRTNPSPHFEDSMLLNFGVNRNWLIMGWLPVMAPGDPFPDSKISSVLIELNNEEIVKYNKNRRNELLDLVSKLGLSNTSIARLAETFKRSPKDEGAHLDGKILSDILTERVAAGKDAD